ncbi:hypothetical protein ABW21_db0205900 [Orbilia brochopaga]|nr:hypothetical protein ABW21_db0205900 [Drechslerella brochopaga]
MVESQAATPQHTQLDAPADDYVKGTSPPTINGDVKLEEEAQADTANKMDVDESPAPREDKAALRRSPSVDMITSPAPAQADELKTEEESLDEKVERIVETSNVPVVEGAKYYVVDVRWWKRFLAQMSEFKPSKEDDFDINAPVPPLDTSYLIDRIEVFPGGKTFPVLKESLQLMQDFEIVPQGVYDELVSLYGANDKSPVLVRTAINTAARDATSKNLTVDLHPPIYTVYLLTPSTSTFQQLKESVNKSPKKIMMGKTAKFQEFLVEIKQILGLESRDKIRLWRFRESEGCRAPKISKVDIITFLDYEFGTSKELIDLPDMSKQVLNGTYNGTMTLVEAGISQDKFFIVEIEEDGEWPSERASRALQRTGVDTIRVTKGTQVTTSVSSAKQANSSNSKQARTPQVTKSLISSMPAMARNVMTRRDGRAPGAVGFSNLGNTCYMNSALQCIKSVEELSRYFIEGLHKRELNPRNPISSGGKIATMYAQLVQTVYSTSAGSSVAPREFKAGVGRHNTIFSGYGQQDSQEFVSYLLDTLHEDLNRILQKPVVEFPDSTDEMVGDPVAIAKLAEENWELYRKRNDSVIIDLFAGMYKSTVTCPVCDKTSIKFDPWLSCQLPLPMENLWSKAITFVPACTSASPYERLVTVHVEMEKYATIKQLKDFVSKRLGVDSKKMVVSEVFRNKFYKHHEDNKSVSEAIMPNDQIYVYEVDETPTNFPPPKRKKPMMMMTRLTMSSMFHSSWDDDEYEDDFDKTETRELLVPVFNRLYKDNRRMGADLFGIPSFVVLNREEQKDPDAILKKIVSNLQKFTTSDMYSPDLSPKRPGGQQAGMRHVEPNVLEEEGEVVNIPAASKAESDTDTGTEDFVDVKMGDAESEINVDMTATPATTRSDVSEEVLRHWRQLFTMKIMPRKGYVVLPTAWNGIELNLEMLKTRIVEVPTPVEEDPPEIKKPNGSKYFHSPPASDDSDADAETEHDGTGVADMMDASDEDVAEPAVLSSKTRNAFSSITTHSFYGNGGSAKSSSASINKKASARKAGKKPMVVEQGPLVKLGEALVCDWNQDAFDAVFGGKSGDSFRGSSHFDAVEEFDDEELRKKRAAREARRRRGIHIDDCFDEFGKEEILNDDNQWYCPRCKEHRNAKKSMQIWRVPDIIALQFKRFSSTRSFRDKIDATIEFPIEGLDLTDRVLESDGKSLQYDLIAVDNHFGGLGGGHYTANARNWVDNKWYYFDDSSARQTAASSINGSAAYLVFYRRRSAGILGGPKMETLLEKSMSSTADSDDESPNGAGSPNGDPSSFSGGRYSSGSQLGSSSLGYSADGQRGGGAGGISSLRALQGSSGNRATSFAGQTTPPPEEKRSFTIDAGDDNQYYSVNPTRPQITSTTLFGESSSSGVTTFKSSGLGAHHDFGVSRYGYDGVGIDEGLDADDDFDDGLLGHDSPGLQDSDDDDAFPYGPAPMSMVSPYFEEDYDDSDSNIPGSGTLSFNLPQYSIISRESPHYGRYNDVREELAAVLEGGSYTMTLVTKKTNIIKPCVLIVTPQLDVEDQLHALCEGMKLELEIVQGEPTFNYELPDGGDRMSNNLGTLVGPIDSPGKFSAVALYLRDSATREIYALTTASAFAQRDPEVETNIPPRFLTTALPEGSIVTQPPTEPGDSVNMATAFGTLTKMYELDICETDEGEAFMFNYALIKVNKERIGTNAVLSKGINRPVLNCVPVSEVSDASKVTVTQGGGGTPAMESKYGSVVTDVHDMARFPGRPFKMYTLFSETKSLSTPGTLGSLCCSPERVGFAASGMVSGRARTMGGYVSNGGSVLHLVQSIEWIFRRVKERWDVDLELLLGA